ncbi:MAG: dihydroorotate dehydrogenase electron transfer subunit [Oscillospiraceae bacterium]|nr:dihydroorotate dehydrogenase electron transfer subunit [Oscillospiraceae bacterium]
MRQTLFEITSNRRLAGEDIYELCLAGDTGAISAPGQFVNLRLDGFYLRRPISVCDWAEGRLTLIYKVLGRGTAAMTAYPAGRKLDVLTGLGNGYNMEKSGMAPLLVGGGVGVPPLYGLAKRLAERGVRARAVLGFNRAADRFLCAEFAALGVPVTLTTVDGSTGLRGFVTDGMAAAGDYSYVYTCGPEAMLKAVYAASRTSGQFSFEERMGCGFGACMGCSCQTKYGARRICRDGPVLEKEEIVW